jgi:signal transduction histidine kinase
MHTEQWEEAYLALSRDATIGRLFRGLVHNLNGAVQVFALQTDLLILMMERLVADLTRMQQESPSEELAGLLDYISRRGNSLPRMKEKVRQSQQILQRTIMLPDCSRLADGSPYTVNALVQIEVEFLCADGFFKHKVARKLDLAPGAPPLARWQPELHQLVHILLVNALEAVQEVDGPEIAVASRTTAGALEVVVQDNGPGMTEEVMARMREPFFSTREGHQGLGLYLADRLVARCHAVLACESRPGCTRFSLRLPCAGEGA